MAKQSQQLSSMAAASMAAASMALEDLSNWELIDVEDDDYDAVFDVQSIDSLSSFSSSEADSDSDQEQDEDEDQAAGPRNYLDAVMGSSPPPPPIPDAIVCVRTINLSPNFDDDRDKKVANHTIYDDDVDDDDDDDDDVVDDDDDDGYGIDDELVPWEVKNRFERQRMRKLGKRAFAKMGKSKSSGLLYTKRGCVRGKHALGLKAF